MTVKSISKASLMAHIADQAGVEQSAVSSVLSALEDVVHAEITVGHAVALPGICKVEVRDRAARVMRNPATGAPIEKAADRAVKISPVKAFKDSANT
jgi:DNA-binding protein HU-beta